MADCGCGRSPTGQCIGWHALSEEEYQQKLKEHQEKAEKADSDDELSRFLMAGQSRRLPALKPRYLPWLPD